MRTMAIVVLPAGIKCHHGRWQSLELTCVDNRLGAPGGKERVKAAALLARKYSKAAVYACGGYGLNVPAWYPSPRPRLCEVLTDELVEAGVERSRIVQEPRSNTTWQSLCNIKELVDVDHDIDQAKVVTSLYHVPRVGLMLRDLGLFEFCFKPYAAETVLFEHDPGLGKDFARAYTSTWLQERLANERHGTEQFRAGKYNFS